MLTSNPAGNGTFLPFSVGNFIFETSGGSRRKLQPAVGAGNRCFSTVKKIEKNFAVLQNLENVMKRPNSVVKVKFIDKFFGKFSGNRKHTAKISALSKTAQCAIVQNIETMGPPDGPSRGHVMNW